MEPPAPRRRVTIVDVARHAQVSTAAVSKVLRDAYGASPEMRRRCAGRSTSSAVRHEALMDLAG
ncbi:regulatory protein, lacI family [Streptomyces sp. 3214.6]|nr:regulatory protein, lacI family [Streptomyces sp. 3214.6]